MLSGCFGWLEEDSSLVIAVKSINVIESNSFIVAFFGIGLSNLDNPVAQTFWASCISAFVILSANAGTLHNIRNAKPVFNTTLITVTFSC